jgi:peroxiredoxin
MTQGQIPTDTNLFALPEGLPNPLDDGAARHLLGAIVPHVRLLSTSGRSVDVGEVAAHLSVFFVYPATVAPGVPIPGEWSEVPGARGCTVQNLRFRDLYPEFMRKGCEVYGVSGQGKPEPRDGLSEQREAKARLGLPFELLNDSEFRLARALNLPTFVPRLKDPVVTFEGRRSVFPLQGRKLHKRLTFLADRGRIERVFYPVFPPDLNATEVLGYLSSRAVA